MLRLSIILIATLWAGFLIWGTPSETTPQSGQNLSDRALRAASVPIYSEPTILSVDRPTPTTARAAPPAVLAVQIATEPTSPEKIVPTEELPLLTVTGSRVNLRTGPSTQTDIVMSLSLGSVTEALSPEKDGWTEIRDLNTGLSGYMSAQFLELL